MMTACDFSKVIIDRLALVKKKTDLKKNRLIESRIHAGNIPAVIIADDTF